MGFTLWSVNAMVNGLSSMIDDLPIQNLREDDGDESIAPVEVVRNRSQ